MKDKKWLEELLASHARPKVKKGGNPNDEAMKMEGQKPKKKKAFIPDVDKALYKAWEKEWYAKKYADLDPRHAPKPKPKSWARYSNFLEDAIGMWAKLHEYPYAKIDVKGTYRNGKYTPTRATNGVEDVQLVINGKTYAIEIKVGKDVQSEAQKKRQAELEAQGIEYVIIGHLEQFAKWAKKFEQ